MDKSRFQNGCNCNTKLGPVSEGLPLESGLYGWGWRGSAGGFRRVFGQMSGFRRRFGGAECRALAGIRALATSVFHVWALLCFQLREAREDSSGKDCPGYSNITNLICCQFHVQVRDLS